MSEPARVRSASVLHLLFILIALAACGGDDGARGTAADLATPPPIALPSAGEVEVPLGSGRTFYLGQEACDDNGPGSEAQPFCTFEPARARLQPGDTLTIQDGVYTGQVTLEGWLGAEGNPITLRGQSREGVIFDGGCPEFPCGLNDVAGSWDDETGMISLVDSAHLVLRDVTIRNVIAVGVTIRDGQGITISGVTVRGTGHAGLLALYSQDVAILGNDIGYVQRGWRDEDDDVQVGAHESLSIVGITRFVVADNYVHDSLKEGIDIKESASDGEAYGNFVERTCLVGIYINEAQGVDVRDNRVRRAGYFLNSEGQEESCDQEPTFGDKYGDYFGGGILLAVGDLGDLSTGRLSDIAIYRNAVWDSAGNGLEFWDEGGYGTMAGYQVYNNVFYGTTFAGIRLEDVTGTAVYNNVLALNEEDPFTGDAIDDNEISHNLFQLAYDWQETYGNHAVEGDPLFVNPALGDFRVRPGSPAIDAGLDVGLPFSDRAPEIGAFEYEAESGPAGATASRPAPLPLADVRFWAYQIQDVSAPGAVAALAASRYDMLVIEPTRTDWSSDDRDFDTRAAVTELKNSLSSDGAHRKLVVAYIDIGEAEDWRWYWEWSTGWDCSGPKPADWPGYILTCDPDGWGGNYPVAYWDPAWQDTVIYGNDSGTHPNRDYTSIIDEVIGDGFDGIYLDWVEGYENDVVAQTAQALGLDPALEMIAFIQRMREYAQERQPGFLIIQQNAAALADGRPQLFDTIDAIAQEAIWFDGDATDEWEDPEGHDWLNDADLTDYYLSHLQLYLEAGIPVFVCEYALAYAPDAYANAAAEGYVPYVTRRSLSRLTTTPPAFP